MMDKRYPMPHPMGWYHVAFSDELKLGSVRPVKYFGRHWVLFRTESGAAKLLDAFCPHLGAHLGHGGVVSGDTVVCPFHSWRFTGDGICVDVPYAKKTPKAVGKTLLRSWPVAECNRSIYVWYHPREKFPAFESISLPEFSQADDEWTVFLRKQWVVRCHIQELHENIVDSAHFRSVHHLTPRFDYYFDGHRSRVVMDSAPSDSRINSRIITERNGPGQTWAHYEGFPEFICLDPVTPIDNEHVKVNLAVAFRKLSAEKLRSVHEKVLADMCRQVERDIPIFENKIYRTSPLYCDGDGPIKKFREWYQQFYAI